MTRKLFSDYGMILVLILLCLLFSVLTLKEQTLQDSDAMAELIEQVKGKFKKSDIILTVGAVNKDSAPFAEKLHEELEKGGFSNARNVVGIPRDLRLAMDDIKEKGNRLAAIATSGEVLKWGVIERISEEYPQFTGCEVLAPESYLWPDFLKRSNLLAIVDRIVVIAVIAIGMTMVIITAGIDLSVGSLIALAAVVSTLVMKKMGGLQASGGAVLAGFTVGVLCCGVIGGFAGFIVSRFKVAPFITTLGVMMMARGLAFTITGGFSIYQVPKALPWLGQGRSLGIPNTVLLLVVLYTAAHVLMTHTRLGRYIYAVGGNEEAARLSGVPVKSVIVFVYVVSSLAAGLGGCIQASQLNSGAPNIGVMYELYVIAAVVVGGTSLSGGTGRILGTLIGAFIIAVIQNGMNLLGIESYTQQIVLGGVILAAVLLDKVRSAGRLPRLLSRKIEVLDQ
ncbi:MAG: ABC transporter permease [Phycisphaerales bacterium]|jgi:ribose transport system permease protein